MKILIAGDFAPRYRISKMIEDNDFHFFDEVKIISRKADYSILNLETPLSDNLSIAPIPKTGPNLIASTNTAFAIRYAGFDAVTLANNHLRDYGQPGIKNTIEACQKAGLEIVGGGLDKESARKILYIKSKTIKIAIINVCEQEWSIATEKYGGANPLNPISLFYDINEAKNNANVVILIIHGGTEHYGLPTPRMKNTYRYLVDVGADVIVNHHQHCYSGYEIYNGKPIFYGLGNFCFDNNKLHRSFWNEGYVVILDIEKSTITYNLYPYEQCLEKPTVHFLEYHKDFDNSLNELNNIIADDAKLNLKFHEMAMTRGDVAVELMEPLRSDAFKVLRAHGIIPSFVGKYAKMELLAYTRCESHRDIILEYLINDIQ